MSGIRSLQLSRERGEELGQSAEMHRTVGKEAWAMSSETAPSCLVLAAFREMRLYVVSLKMGRTASRNI